MKQDLKIKIVGEKTFEPGENVFYEGDEDKEVYIILSGAVNILKSMFGVEIVVDVLVEGNIFGEMAFISGIPRTASAQAMGKTVLGILDPASMEEEKQALSPVWKKILENFVDRLKKTTEDCTATSYVTDGLD